MKRHVADQFQALGEDCLVVWGQFFKELPYIYPTCRWGVFGKNAPAIEGFHPEIPLWQQASDAGMEQAGLSSGG
jgi:hypothetical protein